jgi:hypothetical protein
VLQYRPSVRPLSPPPPSSSSADDGSVGAGQHAVAAAAAGPPSPAPSPARVWWQYAIRGVTYSARPRRQLEQRRGGEARRMWSDIAWRVRFEDD